MVVLFSHQIKHFSNANQILKYLSFHSFCSVPPLFSYLCFLSYFSHSFCFSSLFLSFCVSFFFCPALLRSRYRPALSLSHPLFHSEEVFFFWFPAFRISSTFLNILRFPLDSWPSRCYRKYIRHILRLGTGQSVPHNKNMC